MATEDEFEIMDRRFKNRCVRARKLFSRKNRQYNNTIVLTGVLGAAVELIGASARLKPLVLNKSKEEGLEEGNIASLVDVARDIHNYANILLMMLSDKNWSGK